jgi:hypothetical protein
MRKIIGALAVIAIALVSCTSPPPPERDPFGKTLASAVSRAYQTHQTVKLEAVTTFAWDRFYAFKPKQSPDQINAALGFQWATDYSDQTDTYCLLAFVVAKRVAYSLLYPRYRGDCKTIDTGPYTPRTALFAVTSAGTTTGGTPFLQLQTTP